MTETSSNACGSSSSSFSSSQLDTEEDRTLEIILPDGGRTLAKRLSHLDSIPHAPRVNTVIPDVDDATLDHERLLQRLSTYGLAELQIEGDGNCQFRALADQLFQNPDHHKYVRKQVVKQLKHQKKLYESYVPMNYKSYMKKMRRLGEWGDHVTLQAAADRFGAKICLLTSFRDTGFIEIVPREGPIKKGAAKYSIYQFKCISCSGCFMSWFPISELWLSFWSEIHYNSVYEIGDVPSRTPRRKHWLF